MARPALRSLVVLPDDSAGPVLDAINLAKKSIRIKVFTFSDTTALRALVHACHRGVATRVILNADRPGRDERNKAVAKKLRAAGIEVLDGSPEFSVTHEKSMVVDGAMGFVQSFNWEPENLKETRDFAVLTRDAVEVEEIIDCFEADWERQPFTPKEDSNLIWCPGNGRQRLAYFIDHAQESLVVQNERFHDSVIIERLVRARTRGVKVHVLTRAAHSLSAEKLAEGISGLQIMHDVGIKIHNIKHLKLHSKMLLADEARAIIGSINISAGSFDKRRELAIEVADVELVERLTAVAHKDWKNSNPLDVSDEGIAADLARHHMGGLVSL